MRLFTILCLLPVLAWGGESQFNALSVSYSQHRETISFRSIEKDLSADTVGIAYTYVSETGNSFHADIWREGADAKFGNGALVEKNAWGGGLSFAYPYETLEFALSYSYSHPELEARSTSLSRAKEENQSREYALSVSTFFEHREWSLIPSLELGYQRSDATDRSWINNNVLLTESSQQGWFVTTSVNLSYLYEPSQQVSISPYMGLVWTDFFQGNGLTRTTVFRRNISLNLAEDSNSETDSSGVAHIGLSFSLAQYHLDLSVDEAIDLPDIDTQLTMSVGVIW